MCGLQPALGPGLLQVLHFLAWAYPFMTGLALFIAFVLELGGPHSRVPEMRVGLYLFANAALSYALKHLVNSPRPNGMARGFPSAHSCWAWGLSTMAVIEILRERAVSQKSPRLTRGFSRPALLIVSAIFVSWSRIETLAHTLIQVIAGAIIGVVSAVFWSLASWATGEVLESTLCGIWDKLSNWLWNAHT